LNLSGDEVAIAMIIHALSEAHFGALVPNLPDERLLARRHSAPHEQLLIDHRLATLRASLACAFIAACNNSLAETTGTLCERITAQTTSAASSSPAANLINCCGLKKSRPSESNSACQRDGATLASVAPAKGPSDDSNVRQPHGGGGSSGVRTRSRNSTNEEMAS